MSAARQKLDETPPFKGERTPPPSGIVSPSSDGWSETPPELRKQCPSIWDRTTEMVEEPPVGEKPVGKQPVEEKPVS